MLSLRQYNGNGQYLYKETAMDNFPYFVASAFERYGNVKWYEKGVYTRGCGKFKEFREDKKFITNCFVWSMITDACHAKSHEGVVENQLCFDNDTWADKKYNEIFIKNREYLSKHATNLYDKFKSIIKHIQNKENASNKFYNPKLTYGLFQIDSELNIYDEFINGTSMNKERLYRDTELNRMIVELKELLKTFYQSEIVEDLKKYELVK